MQIRGQKFSSYQQTSQPKKYGKRTTHPRKPSSSSMEALSTSVSTLRFPGLSSTGREPHQPFRPSTNRIPSQESQPHTHISNRTASSSLPSPSFETHRPPSSIALKSSQHLLFQSPSHGPPLKSPTLFFHRTAASGYAAALLDVARCNNNVADVVEDVRTISKLLVRSRFLRSLMADATVDNGKKGELLEEVARRAGSTKHVAVLMKMLGQKRKAGLVGEVLEEFKRMYDEWCGVVSVLVCSKEKVQREQLRVTAKQMQVVSGAHKVKVRNVVGESLPNFVTRIA